VLHRSSLMGLSGALVPPFTAVLLGSRGPFRRHHIENGSGVHSSFRRSRWGREGPRPFYSHVGVCTMTLGIGPPLGSPLL